MDIPGNACAQGLPRREEIPGKVAFAGDSLCSWVAPGLSDQKPK